MVNTVGRPGEQFKLGWISLVLRILESVEHRPFSVIVTNLPDCVPPSSYKLPEGTNEFRVKSFDDQYDVKILGGPERLASFVHRQPRSDATD
ncbi:hypothetical protein TOC8172_41020 [Pseudomonas syringae]